MYWIRNETPLFEANGIRYFSFSNFSIWTFPFSMSFYIFLLLICCKWNWCRQQATSFSQDKNKNGCDPHSQCHLLYFSLFIFSFLDYFFPQFCFHAMPFCTRQADRPLSMMPFCSSFLHIAISPKVSCWFLLHFPVVSFLAAIILLDDPTDQFPVLYFSHIHQARSQWFVWSLIFPCVPLFIVWVILQRARTNLYFCSSHTGLCIKQSR